MTTIQDNMSKWLDVALNASYRRNTVLSGNLANVDTPGFVPRDLDFTEELKTQLESPATVGEAAVPAAEYRPNQEMGLDGNQVDLDTEVANMAANRLYYDLATEVVNRRTALLRYAITEGGR